MMDGVQLRWLRTPGQDLNAMWAECEDTLFPPAHVGGLPLSSLFRHCITVWMQT